MNNSKKQTPSLYNAGNGLMLALLVLVFGLNSQINAQTPAELGTGSYTGSVNGPTAVSQSGRLLLNTTGTTYATPKTNVTITATISNQQFTGVNTGTGSPVLMFGGTNTTNGTAPTARPTYAAMSDIATPANSMYSNQADGTAAGVDVATNLAFNMYTSVYQWANTNSPSPSNRTYIADLTLNFSTPLTNPLLHIVGLGGTSSSSFGFSSELDLTTQNVTISRLQGNTALAVTGSQINNANSTGIGASCSTNIAACGTIKVTGNNIQSLTFKVYIRGNNGSTANWCTTTSHAGDQWLIGVSIPETYSVSGNVFNDVNGMGDNTVNGTGIGLASGVQLYANMIEPGTGKIIGSVPVAANGTYSFDGIPAGANVKVEISKNQGTDLSLAPAKALPNGWSYNGEHIGTSAGSETPPDGALAFAVPGNVTNVNFGVVNFGPSAAAVSITGRAVTADGRGIRNVLVTLTDLEGNSRSVLTGPFGNYRFDKVTAGETYVISVSGKRFQFEQPTQIINVSEDLIDLNFYAY